jgi:hypothetical protein
MCYSMHFHKVLATPTNAQLILLHNDKPTCFGPLWSSSGLILLPTTHAYEKYSYRCVPASNPILEVWPP